MFAVPADTIALPAVAAAAHPARVALDVARDRASWAPLLRYDPQERFSALVSRTPFHEVWLLSWLPGQHTDLHDHGGAEGAFTVVTGALTEHAYPAGSPEATHHVVAGQARVFGPDYAHRVANDGLDPAVSIHVYRPERRQRPRNSRVASSG